MQLASEPPFLYLVILSQTDKGWASAFPAPIQRQPGARAVAGVPWIDLA
jgi:hypothetical protein